MAENGGVRRMLPDPDACVAETMPGIEHFAVCRVRSPESCSAGFNFGTEFFCRNPQRGGFIERFQGKRARLRNVLCVDDEPDILHILKHALQRMGKCQVHLCEDPTRAVQAARATTPDLILLDVIMPKLDGRALFKRFGAEPALAGIPVIFLTASIMGQDLRELQNLGAAGIIGKPFNLQSLIVKLLEIWCEHAP